MNAFGSIKASFAHPLFGAGRPEKVLSASLFQKHYFVFFHRNLLQTDVNKMKSFS